MVSRRSQIALVHEDDDVITVGQLTTGTLVVVGAEAGEERQLLGGPRDPEQRHAVGTARDGAARPSVSSAPATSLAEPPGA